MEEIKDVEILNRFRNEVTRHEAFNALVHKYHQKIYWHIRRLVIDHNDADDVVQNVFLKIWQNLVNFREEANLYTWIYRIATNEALAFINKKNKMQILSADHEDADLANKLKADKYFNGDEIQIKLQQAINQLPEKQKVVFNMRYYDEMKYEEMSLILETSVGALKASYHHALKKIEKFLTEN